MSQTANAAVTDVLRSCGVTLASGEFPLAGLRRHAQERRWRQATLKRWENRLLKHLQSIADAAFDSLSQMNVWLVALGLSAQTTKSAARATLRKVFINIYDLLQGHFDRKHRSLAALRNYTRENRLFYPLRKAKSEGLRDFLRALQ